MNGETKDLRERLHLLENTFIPRLAARTDPIRAEAIWRQNTLAKLYTYLDEAEEALKTSDSSRLNSLQAELEEEARKREHSLQQISDDDVRYRLVNHDIGLYGGVAHLLGTRQPGHARNSFLASEERQVDNTFTNANTTDGRLTSAFDEAYQIRQELRRRGELT